MNNSIEKSSEQGNSYCLYNSALVSDVTPEMLTADYWQAKNAITGSAQGRGTTWFIRYSPEHCNEHSNEKSIEQNTEQSTEAPPHTQAPQAWVLRHYYRGGLIGKLIKDSYIFNGIENSRAVREFTLLKQMQHWQLPAPAPVACRVMRHGLFGLCYRADLLSSRIENAQDLVAILSKKEISDELWQKIGETIKRFHDHEIYHHDLNSHNILIDAQQDVYLIDFDRGEIRSTEVVTSADKTVKNSGWKESNLSRLKRSFLKELNQLEHFNFTDKNWEMLLSGYTNNK